MFEQYESLSSEDARRIVDERLSEWGVAYAAHYAGERVKRDLGNDPKGQTVDAFRVIFGDWETDFYMGTGNRELSKAHAEMSQVGLIRAAFGWGHNNGTYNPRSERDRRMLAKAKEALKKPVNPTAADVLYCLLSDAEACDMSFSDWCDTFGADSDSIKALSTYQACERAGRELSRTFNHARVAELRAILQNY